MSTSGWNAMPATIGRYQIRSLIGQGGMGEVYEAFDPSLDRVVALKTIKGGAGADGPVLLERLYREARACGRLRHPHIVTVHDLGEADGVVFIAMEYLHGENLAMAIERGTLGLEQKIRILMQILDALEYAHGEGVIHRDIKPSNVHLLADGSIKLLDFGLARVAQADGLTKSGAIMGTPDYTSPEQLKGQPLDGRADVYSTGIVAYELLTGRRAFEGESLTAVILKVLSEPPPPMATAWSSTFPEIEQIVDRAAAKSPADRFPSAKAMRDALDAFLTKSLPALAALPSGTPDEAEMARVRELIQQQTIVNQPLVVPPAPAPVPPARPAARTVVIAPAMADRPAASREPSAPAPVVGPPSGAANRSRVRTAIWIGAAVAVILVAMRLSGVAPSSGAPGVDAVGDAPPRVATPSAQGTVSSPVPLPQAAPPVPDAPTAQTAVATSPITPAPGPAPGPGRAEQAPGGGRATVRQPPGPAGGRDSNPFPPGPAVGPVNPRLVFLNAAMDEAVRAEFETALRARGLTVASVVQGAGLVAAARVDVTVRAAPFRGSSALTADYVATVDLIDRRTGNRETLRITGQALEFGETVARAAAVRAAAERMADAVVRAVRE